MSFVPAICANIHTKTNLDSLCEVERIGAAFLRSNLACVDDHDKAWSAQTTHKRNHDSTIQG